METLKSASEASRAGYLVLTCCLIVLLGALFYPSEAHSASSTAAWIKKFEDSQKENIGAAVGISGAGESYAGGMTLSALSGQKALGDWDGFLRKLGPAGEILWTRQFGSGGTDSVEGLAVDAGGNLYVVGTVAGHLPNQTSRGSTDAYIRKYDSQGKISWTRQFGTAGFDIAKEVAIDPAGRIYVVGSTGGAMPGQVLKGKMDAWLRKFSPSGAVSWTRQFGTAELDAASNVSVDAFGKIYVTGIAGAAMPNQRSIGGADAFLRKYGPKGKVYWTRQFGSAGADAAAEVVIDSQQNVYVTGQQRNDKAFARKFSQKGAGLWSRTWSSSIGTGAAVDAENNLYVVGVSASSSSAKAFARKFTSAGSLLWNNNFTGGMALDAASDKDGRLYVVGTTGLSNGHTFVAKFD